MVSPAWHTSPIDLNHGVDAFTLEIGDIEYCIGGTLDALVEYLIGPWHAHAFLYHIDKLLDLVFPASLIRVHAEALEDYPWRRAAADPRPSLYIVV